MFGANPTWSKKLQVWGKAGVVAEGKDSKTGDKGATMMFVGMPNAKATVYECGICAHQGS